MQTEEKPFKIGLALGGGAMRGLAHIGAMQVMEEHGIMPDVVAGTSIGAFVGGVYACGMSLKMMERFCYSINEKDLMDVVRPRQGLIGGARIERMLRTLTGNRTFDQARLPFAAVATELERGERFVFQEGPIWEGVRASISIPGIFVPFHTGGHTYVDGGVVDRVPIAAARELGADFVIGVDVGYRGGESPCDDLFKIILHSMEIMEWQVMQRRVGEGDFVLAPSLLEINPASMAQAETCIRIGREEMQRRLPELQEAIEKKKAELAARQE